MLVGIWRCAPTCQSQFLPKQVLQPPFFERHRNIFVLLFLTRFLIGCATKQEKPAMEPPEVKVTEVVQRECSDLSGVGRTAQRPYQRSNLA